MKKFFVFLFMMMMFACDNSTNPNVPETPVDKPSVVYDTVLSKKTVILAKNVVYDTTRTTIQNNTIIGSLISKDVSVVCSEIMNRCAKTNSSGMFMIEPISRPVVAGRIFNITDTVDTPENIVPITPDTTITPLGNDTNVVSDTNMTQSLSINGNDTLVSISIEIIDTVYSADSIKVDITIPSEVPVKDTLTVVTNGTILREIPINSWGHILKDGFVDKWSIEVYDTIASLNIDTVQFVYFATGDSIAQVVTLGREKIGDKYTNRFSGSFFYYWDDSAYTKDKFIHNYFIRAKDSSGAIVSKTDMVNFSAKAFPETKVYLKKNVHVPQYMIEPKIIPSAKNNKTLKDAVIEYTMTEDRSKNWIGIEQLPCNYTIDTITGAVSINGNFSFNFDSIGVYKVSFDIETSSDSVMYGYTNKPFVVYSTNNITKHHEVFITKNMIIKICGRENNDFVKSTVTNIRFIFKE